MKVFTVYQPYAFAIVAGLKHYETRPRRTNIRGRVAVHAAIGGPDYISVALDSILPESMELHYGAVVGTVEIVDCVPVENLVDSLDDRERLLGDYSPGRFAWVLENPVMFDEPFPARGKQGWWNWDQRAAEMSRQIKREITRAATDLLYTPHTEDGISAVNSAVSEIVKQYCDSGEIAHGPTTDDISLGGAPLEVLPFLPFAIQTISGYGTYSVYNIDVTYYTQEGGAISDDVISENVNAAVGAFKKWQAEKMGRDVNPSYLIQLLMQAGVKRVEVRAPAFATVKDNQVAKIGTTTVTNGGAESE